MRNSVLKVALFISLVFTSHVLSAEPVMSVEASVRSVVAELEDVKGVNSMVLQKGHGLGLVKAILKPKLGKEFLEGVTTIIIVEYSKASEEIATSIQNRLDSYSATLQKFEFSKNEFGGGESVKGYVAIDETMTASDLVMIVENKGAKLFIYMGGVLKAKELDLSPKQ